MAFGKYLKRVQPDGVLAAMWPLTFYAVLACRLARYAGRIVVSEHNTLSVQYADWGRAHRVFLRASLATGYRLADARVGVSTGVVEDMAQLSRMQRDRFTRINNPLPRSSDTSVADRRRVEEYWRGGKGPRILSVGRLKPQKNHALLLEAVSSLLSNDPTARLVLVGDGPCEADLKRQARTLGIRDQVIFAGFQSRTRGFYESCDVFVLASDYEGFGNVLLEALATGARVVSTDCPSGPRDILADGRYGALVPRNDPQAMQRAIGTALSASQSEEDIARLRARACEFDVTGIASQYLALLFPDRRETEL